MFAASETRTKQRAERDCFDVGPKEMRTREVYDIVNSSIENLSNNDFEAHSLARLEDEEAIDVSKLEQVIQQTVNISTMNIETDNELLLQKSQYQPTLSKPEMSGRESYSTHFNGLKEYGESGMSVLEELIEAAFSASDKAVAACSRINTGASLLVSGTTSSMGKFSAGTEQNGRRIFAAFGVESISDANLSVSAERACLLKAVSEGYVNFEGMAIANAFGDTFPVPDGPARQLLSEYGDFPLFLVNRHMRCKKTSTYTLFPLRAAQAAAHHEKLTHISDAATLAAKSKNDDHQKVRDEDVVSAARRQRAASDPREWSVAQVLYHFFFFFLFCSF